MKNRIKALGLAFIIVAGSIFGLYVFYKKYRHDVEVAYPVEQKIMAIYDQGYYPSDDQLEEMRKIEPYRKSRTVNLWWLTLFGSLIFFTSSYILFEFFVHGKKKTPKAPADPNFRFKHIKVITPPTKPDQLPDSGGPPKP